MRVDQSLNGGHPVVPVAVPIVVRVVVRVVVRAALASLAASCLLLAGCGQQQRVPAAPQEAVPAPRPDAAPAPAAVPNSQASNLEGYKRDVADRIYLASAERIFSGPPPNLLRSVVVLSVVIDAGGQVAGVRVFRDNGDAETTRIAIESARQGAPYPRPPARLLRGGRLEFSETWLFQDDGRFQLRTRAEAWQQ